MPAIAALLLCLQFVPDPAPPPASQPWPELPIRFHTLDNGLRIVAVEDAALDELSVQLWFRAGSALDPPGAPGLALIAFAALGATGPTPLDRAFPGWQHTVLRDACLVRVDVQRTELDASLQALAGWLQPVRVTPEMRDGALAISSSRKVRGAYAIVERGLPYPFRGGAFLPPATRGPLPIIDETWVELLALALPDHPYGHPPTFIADQAPPTPERLQEFINRWFVASNATLFIIGDVAPPLAIDQARRALSGLPWAPPPRRPELTRPQREVVQRETGDGGLFVAWVTPPWSYVESAAIDVVLHRLCNPADGPLASLARQLELTLRWERFAWRDCGLAVLVARPTTTGPDWPQRCAKFEQALDPALAKLADEVWDPVALRRARTLAWRGLLNERADPARRAWRIAAHEVIGGDGFLAEYESGMLASMPLAEVRRGVEALRAGRRAVLMPNPDGRVPRSDNIPPLAQGWVAQGPVALAATQPDRRVRKPQHGAEAQRAGGRLQLAVDQKAAAELVVLRIALEPPGVVNTIENQLREVKAPYTWPMLLDLSSYRGIEWRIDAGAGTPQLEISAPADELAGLIEIAAAVLLGLPDAANVTQYRLTITVPQPPVEVLELCDRYWTPRMKN